VLPTTTPLGQMLRSGRVAAGLSQNEFARRVGVDQAYVNRLESGKGKESRPSRWVVERFIQVLGLDLEKAEQLRVTAGYCPATIEALDPDRFLALISLLGGVQTPTHVI